MRTIDLGVLCGVLALVTAFIMPAAGANRPIDGSFVQSGLIGQPHIRTDLDGDNQSDSIWASANGTVVSVKIFLSRSSRQTSFQFASSARSLGILALDVTDDGQCDLIFTNGPRSKAIALCVNRGDGTFDVHPCGGLLHDGLVPEFPFDDHNPIAIPWSSNHRTNLEVLANGPRSRQISLTRLSSASFARLFVRANELACSPQNSRAPPFSHHRAPSQRAA